MEETYELGKPLVLLSAKGNLVLGVGLLEVHAEAVTKESGDKKHC